ncbi:hypothetical protein [Micromonospora sp. NBC_01813]|uniref:hypothetical protein n=1 Tax=Micromonospora sp. NBC_01813 TaxID=2975988 RepID=UPI002DDABCAC|nr:hypothetical protein [Micromonospora sp. NBC_01813]WSA06639.1 hypothetical protein OG958_20350 [Micromonospora sp. NBC_01813]
MTPDEAVAAMAERLSAVNWERRGDRAWSKAVLLKEYFRRAAQWAAVYDCDSPTPFFDLAHCVDATVRVDQGIIDDILARLDTRGSRSVKRILPFMLHWAALRAQPGIKFPPQLEDPFEPLILLFERGGGFHTETGEVDLEWKSVRMAGWRQRAADPPIADSAPEALDEVDRAGSIAQFGYVVEPL